MSTEVDVHNTQEDPRARGRTTAYLPLSLHRRVSAFGLRAKPKAPAMRRFTLLLLPVSIGLCPLRKTVTSSTSKSCRQLILNFSVDSTILQSDGSYEVYLSNGTTYTQVQGCMDPAHRCSALRAMTPTTAITDAGSCASNCVARRMDGYTYAWWRSATSAGLRRTCVRRCMRMAAAIPEVTDNLAWSGLSTGARCDYNNDASNVADLRPAVQLVCCDECCGAVPNGMACAYGWRVDGFGDYFSANGYSGTEGTALKSTSGWSSGGNGTDDFGFSALPGGFRTLRVATSSLPGTSATGGVLRPVAAMLGPVLVQRRSSHRPDYLNPRSASRSGVLGMPIERSEGGLIL